MAHTGIFVIAYTLSVGRLRYCAACIHSAAASEPVYADLAGACKFWSREQAEDYIANCIPMRCRAYHAIVEAAECDLLLHCPGLYAEMRAAAHVQHA